MRVNTFPFGMMNEKNFFFSQISSFYKHSQAFQKKTRNILLKLDYYTHEETVIIILKEIAPAAKG